MNPKPSSSSSPSSSAPPPLWRCCVSVEGYLNEVPSCVTNLQRGGEAAINICYQQTRLPSQTHTCTHKTSPAPQHTPSGENTDKLHVVCTQRNIKFSTSCMDKTWRDGRFMDSQLQRYASATNLWVFITACPPCRSGLRFMGWTTWFQLK